MPINRSGLKMDFYGENGSRGLFILKVTRDLAVGGSVEKTTLFNVEEFMDKGLPALCILRRIYNRYFEYLNALRDFFGSENALCEKLYIPSNPIGGNTNLDCVDKVEITYFENGDFYNILDPIEISGVSEAEIVHDWLEELSEDSLDDDTSEAFQEQYIPQVMLKLDYDYICDEDLFDDDFLDDESTDDYGSYVDPDDEE